MCDQNLVGFATVIERGNCAAQSFRTLDGSVGQLEWQQFVESRLGLTGYLEQLPYRQRLNASIR